MPASTLPARPSLDQLRKQAKELLKSVRAGDAAASSRFGTFLPTLPVRDAVTLADTSLRGGLASRAGTNWCEA